MIAKIITWPDAVVTNYYQITQVVLSTITRQAQVTVDFHITEEAQKNTVILKNLEKNFLFFNHWLSMKLNAM